MAMKIAFVLLAIAFIAGLGWIIGTSEPFAQCIHQRKAGHAFQALHQNGFPIVRLFVRIRLNSACGADVAYLYQGAFTALSGLALAFFAVTFWWFSWRMVSIASRQRGDFVRSIEAFEQSVASSNRQTAAAERAFSSLERGYVFIQQFETNFWPLKKEEGSDANWAQPHGQVTLVNWGRTPVTITGLLTYALLSDTMPADPDYAERRETFGDIVLPPGRSLKRGLNIQFAEHILDEHVESLMQSRKVVIVVCRVRYEDFVGEEYFRGAAAVYDHRRNLFLTAGGRAFNYDRKATPEERPAYEALAASSQYGPA